MKIISEFRKYQKLLKILEQKQDGFLLNMILPPKI